MPTRRELEQLRAENDTLRRELAEAQDALRAIRSGEVDALVVQTQGGDRVFTLESAYEPYRIFVEHMQQGAASLAPDGLILYSNSRFAEILGAAPERLPGRSIYTVIPPTHHDLIRSLLGSGGVHAQDAEMVLGRPDGAHVHAFFHVTAMPDGTRCAVVTDVTERVRQGEILASREWLRVTLTSIGDAVLSCDTNGRVTFINPVAEKLTRWPETEALGQPIQSVFRIVDEITHEPGCDLVGRVLHEEAAAALANHTMLVTRDGREVAIEDSAAPIRDAAGKLAGVVIVFHDATERRRAQQVLLESEARLLEANRAKDDFLATLSHELRTPMNAVLGWAQMLTTRNLDAATRERGLQAILRNAQAQTQLVTDILDISRIISGRLRLNMRPVDLVGIIYVALDSVRPTADAKGIWLATSITAASTVVLGDADRLQQVVWNLVSNAVKFTPPGGQIDVSLQRNESQFAIRVRDNGIGIAPEFLPHVFERFVQADSSARRRHTGLGLGLSIVHHLVELHGGTVTADSEGKGKGATFTIHLPAHAVQRPAADAQADAGVTQATRSLAGLRVLVVDDEPDARDLVATVLGDSGAQVTTAASAAEAIARLSQERFDILVADICMPEQDGYDLIAHVRHLPARAGGTIPAAALTAYGRLDDAERALASGFQVHLTKPISPPQLVAAIEQLSRRPEPTR